MIELLIRAVRICFALTGKNTRCQLIYKKKQFYSYARKIERAKNAKQDGGPIAIPPLTQMLDLSSDTVWPLVIEEESGRREGKEVVAAVWGTEFIQFAIQI